ncbi:MaoC/PaaZ C-terminal domain-containing protein [Cupriavidus basilensis]
MRAKTRPCRRKTSQGGIDMTLSLSDLVLGTTFESPHMTVDAAEALAFAERFDPQPFHTNDEAARQSIFKGLATSGWYIAAAAFRLILDSGIELHGGIIGQRIEELRWLRPLRPGNTLRVVTEVMGVQRSEKNPRRGTVLLKHVALNQDNNPVLEMRVVVLASDFDFAPGSP